MTFELWHLFLLASAFLLGLLFLLVLAEPGLPYDIDDPLPSPENHEFMGLIAALVDAPVAKVASIEVLTNGVAFYPAEFAAIARARRSVHLEAYVFHLSDVADRLVSLLTERPCRGPRAARHRRDRQLANARRVLRRAARGRRRGGLVSAGACDC